MAPDEPSDCLSELPTRPSHLKLMRVRTGLGYGSMGDCLSELPTRPSHLKLMRVRTEGLDRLLWGQSVYTLQRDRLRAMSLALHAPSLRATNLSASAPPRLLC